MRFCVSHAAILRLRYCCMTTTGFPSSLLGYIVTSLHRYIHGRREAGSNVLLFGLAINALSPPPLPLYYS